jgi:hypothetical protein
MKKMYDTPLRAAIKEVLAAKDNMNDTAPARLRMTIAMSHFRQAVEEINQAKSLDNDTVKA